AADTLAEAGRKEFIRDAARFVLSAVAVAGQDYVARQRAHEFNQGMALKTAQETHGDYFKILQEYDRKLPPPDLQNGLLASAVADNASLALTQRAPTLPQLKKLLDEAEFRHRQAQACDQLITAIK